MKYDVIVTYEFEGKKIKKTFTSFSKAEEFVEKEMERTGLGEFAFVIAM